MSIQKIIAKKPKKIIALCGLIVCASIYLYGVPIPFVSSFFSRVASQTLNFPIHVDAVSTNFITKLKLSGVRISDPDMPHLAHVLTARSIQISINPFKLIGYPFNRAIRQITIKGTSFILTRARNISYYEQFFSKSSSKEKKDFFLPLISVLDSEIYCASDVLVASQAVEKESWLHVAIPKAKIISENKNLHFKIAVSPLKASREITNISFYLNENRRRISARIWTVGSIDVDSYGQLLNPIVPLAGGMQGRLSCDMKITGDFSNDMGKVLASLEVNGKCFLHNIGFDYNFLKTIRMSSNFQKMGNLIHKARFNHWTGSVICKGRSVQIDYLHGFSHNMGIHVSGLWKNIGKKKLALSFEIPSVNTNTIRRILPNAVFNAFKTQLSGTIKGDFHLDEPGYGFKMNMGVMGGVAGRNIPWILDGANFSLSQTMGLPIVEKAKIRLRDVGNIYLRKKGDDIAVHADSITIAGLLPLKKRKNLTHILLKDVEYLAKKEGKETRLLCRGYAVDTRVSYEKAKLTFSIVKSSTRIVGLMRDVSGKHRLVCDARFLEKQWHLDDCILMIAGKKVFSSIGTIPTDKNRGINISFSSDAFETKWLDYILGRRICFIDRIGGHGNIQGTRDRPYLVFTSHFEKQIDKNKSVKGKASFSYVDRVLYVKQFLFDGYAGQGTYNSKTGDAAIYLSMKNALCAPVLIQARALLGVKKTQKFSRMVKDVKITGKVELVSREGKLIMDLKGMVENKQAPYRAKMDIAVTKDKKGIIAGAVGLTDINIHNMHWNNFMTQFQHANNILMVEKCVLDKEFSGQGMVNFKSDNSLSGRFKIMTDRFSELISFIFPKKDIRSKITLRTSCLIRGSLKSPIITTKNLSLNLTKGKQKAELICGILLRNKILSMSKGMLTIDKVKKMTFGGQIPLAKGIFQLSCSLNKLNLKEALNLFDIPMSMEGTADGVIRMRSGKKRVGLGSRLAFDFSLLVSRGRFWGIFCEGAQGTLVMNSGRYTSKGVTLFAEKGTLQIKPGSKLEKIKKGIKVNMRMYGRNWNFFGLFRVFGDTRIKGTWNEKSKHAQARLYLDNMWANRYNFRRNSIQRVEYKDGIISLLPNKDNTGLKAAIRLRKQGIFLSRLQYFKKGKERFFLKGRIEKPSNRISFVSYGKSFPADIFSGIFSLGIGIEGDSDYQLKAEGYLSNPRIDISMKLRDGTMAGMKYDTANGKINLRKDSILLKDITIRRRKQYNLFIHGNIPYPLVESTRAAVVKRKMNISIKSEKTSLKILSALLPDTITKADGDTFIDLSLGNTIFDPVLSGRIRVQKGSLSLADGIRAMKHADIDITIVKNKVMFKRFRANVGGGALEVGGTINLKKLRPERFAIELRVQKEGIPISLSSLPIAQSRLLDKIIPKAPSKGNVAGNISIYGNRQKYTIGGVFTLSDARFTYPPPKDASDGSAFTDFLQYADWDTTIHTGSEVWYENSDVSVEISGKLNIKGPREDTKVNSRIDMIQGELEYVRSNFRIISGNFEIKENEPYIELKAETNITRQEPRRGGVVDDVIVMTIPKARLSDIALVFVSKRYPNTSPKVAMNLAFGGSSGDVSEDETEVEGTGEASTEGRTQEYLQREFFRLIDSTLTSPILSTVLRRTGLVDMVRVHTSIAQESSEAIRRSREDKTAKPITAQDMLKGSSVELGKYLHSHLFLGYSVGLEEEEIEEEVGVKHELEARVQLEKNLYLKGELGMQKDKEQDKKVSVEYRIPFGKFFSGKKKKARRKK